jgi:hypothetical protein
MRRPDTFANYGRRDLLRTIGFTGGLAAVAGCGTTAPAPVAPAATAVPTANPGAGATAPPIARRPEVRGLKVGYLPVTDATPLLVAHH